MHASSTRILTLIDSSILHEISIRQLLQINGWLIELPFYVVCTVGNLALIPLQDCTSHSCFHFHRNLLEHQEVLRLHILAIGRETVLQWGSMLNERLRHKEYSDVSTLTLCLMEALMASR